MLRLWLISFFIAQAFGSDLKGILTHVDDLNKTITVNGNVIKVMPYTEIEQDGCRFGFDTRKVFADLKVNDLVEVDIIMGQDGMLIAKEIEISCMERRAY